jgi:ABC-type nitrate/sulfonate/bicarbonate transport system substrate-binding protein
MNRFSAILLAAFVAASASSQPRAEGLTVLRYGQIASSARSISSLALYVAQRKGFLAKEAIDLDVVGLGGVEHMVEALDKGDVDVSHTATPYLLQAVLKGSDAIAVVGGPANTIFSLVAKPEVKTFADLKGKIIGLSLPVDTISIATRSLLAKQGLASTDYSAKVLVGTPLRADCLSTGACDAVPLGQPDDIVFANKGYTKLGDSLEVIPVLQFNVIAARRAWAEAHKDLVTRFASAFGAAYSFIRDPINRDETVKIISDTTGASPEVARQMLTFYYEPYRGVMPRQGEISLDGMNEVIDLLGETGDLKPPLPSAERFVDLQYLKAAGLQ